MSDRESTEELFEAVTARSREIFASKLLTYGPSWLVFRNRSLADKLWIKAKRIRELEELGDDHRIPEGRETEYLALINYSAVALMRLWHGSELPNDELLHGGDGSDVDADHVLALYDDVLDGTRDLLDRKNHDYGEAWRQMEVSSMTDLILGKIIRIKSILDAERDGDGADLAAEFADIINYAVFAVSKMEGRA